MEKETLIFSPEGSLWLKVKHWLENYARALEMQNDELLTLDPTRADEYEVLQLATGSFDADALRLLDLIVREATGIHKASLTPHQAGLMREVWAQYMTMFSAIAKNIVDGKMDGVGRIETTCNVRTSPKSDTPFTDGLRRVMYE